jgi:hypothetical protein
VASRRLAAGCFRSIGFDKLTAGGFDKLTAGGFDKLAAGGFDRLAAGGFDKHNRGKFDGSGPGGFDGRVKRRAGRRRPAARATGLVAPGDTATRIRPGPAIGPSGGHERSRAIRRLADVARPARGAPGDHVAATGAARAKWPVNIAGVSILTAGIGPNNEQSNFTSRRSPTHGLCRTNRT